MSLNDKLYSLYARVWKQLEHLLLPTDGTLSMPFFIEIPEGYENASFRVVVVGQQTRGWGRAEWGGLLPSDPVDPIKWLQNEYAGTLRESRDGHFWRAVRQLQEELDAYVPPNGLVWANFFPMDERRKIPSLEVQEKLISLRILAQEIELLQPNAVVFFTGPYFRIGLNRMFPDIPTTPYPKRRSPIIALEPHGSPLPGKSYWTYHPRSLYYRGRGVLNDTLDRLAALIKGAV